MGFLDIYIFFSSLKLSTNRLIKPISISPKDKHFLNICQFYNPGRINRKRKLEVLENNVEWKCNYINQKQEAFKYLKLEYYEIAYWIMYFLLKLLLNLNFAKQT